VKTPLTLKHNSNDYKNPSISPRRTRRAARIIVSDRIIQRLMSNNGGPLIFIGPRKCLVCWKLPD